MLRDYCVQNDHPLPTFELVSQFGTTKAPRFTVLCQVASIKRIRTGDNKQTAERLAAFQMFLVIRDPTTSFQDEMELVAAKSKSELEEERVKLFKSYRELVDSNKNIENFGTSLLERHNALTKFHAHLKEAAFHILETKYGSTKEKVYDVLTALKLNAKVNKVTSVQGHEMIYMELDCPGVDISFVGFEDQLYDEIIEYFRKMLE